MSPAAPRTSPARTLRIRTALLEWYDKNKRDLPWRQTRDPYAIWISETMLQQTRVETVIPYYERFLASFPDIAALATADEEKVLEHWAGLGYYSRARNLQKAARAVVDEHAGEFPSEADALQTLPGIGRYTAGALASIAFDRPAPIVDGNVVRVLARVHAIEEDVAGKDVVARLWQEAEALAQGPRPGDFNQALMELGALVCNPRAPQCLVCPLLRLCKGRKQGIAEALPNKQKKKKPVAIAAAAAYIERGGEVLCVRRPPSGLMGGLWELPGGDLEADEAPEAGLRRALRERIGLARIADCEAVGAVEHVFTHRRLTLHVFRARLGRGARVRLATDGPADHRWVSTERSALETLAVGGPGRKALALLGHGETVLRKRRL